MQTDRGQFIKRIFTLLNSVGSCAKTCVCVCVCVDVCAYTCVFECLYTSGCELSLRDMCVEIYARVNIMRVRICAWSACVNSCLSVCECAHVCVGAHA